MTVRERPVPAARDVARVAREVARSAVPLRDAREDLDPLLERIGDARVVLLGEATHGTHEFYRERARITRRLVGEKGFHAVAVEGDWPDCARVDRYVRGHGTDEEGEEALGDFRRFPTWMWRNADVLDFVGWMRAHNEKLADPASGVGFYGLDLYSLHASANAVLHYLEKVDPAGARRARERYACLEAFGEDAQDYGRAAHLGLARDCEDEVVRQLAELRRSRTEILSRDGRHAEEEFFFAEQNARLVKDAETYYRTMFSGRVNSWNVRDTHMAETLDALLRQLDRRHGRGKVVVWAHNSHVGDARATWMHRVGELNIGELARRKWGAEAFLVGFTTYTGTVTAAQDWDEPAERRRVRPALPGSYEDVFHATDLPRFLLLLRGDGEDKGGPQDPAVRALAAERIERAIGVVYRPETERASHYFECALPEQFDAVLHFDETRAVEPLERTTGWESGEAPDTFPTGY